MTKRLVFLLLLCSLIGCSSNNVKKFPDVTLAREKLNTETQPDITITNKVESLDHNIFSNSKFLKVNTGLNKLNLCLPIILDRIGFYSGDEKIIVPNNLRGLVFHHRETNNRSSFIWELFSMTSTVNSVAEILTNYAVDSTQNNQVFTLNSKDELVLNGKVVFGNVENLNIVREVMITEKQIKLLNFNKQVKMYNVKTPFSLKSLPSICESINF